MNINPLPRNLSRGKRGSLMHGLRDEPIARFRDRHSEKLGRRWFLIIPPNLGGPPFQTNRKLHDQRGFKCAEDIKVLPTALERRGFRSWVAYTKVLELSPQRSTADL